MTTFLARTGAVLFAALAMLSLLLAVAALAFGRADGVAFYVALAIGASVVVGVLMRREMKRRRAAEARLPAEQRPARRVPRRPITFPVVETTLTFAAWYAIAIAVDAILNSGTSVFTVSVIAPFAAFMLTTLTIAGRHMAFRLTAEENADRDR